MPLIETTGAASSRGFGQFARAVAANYIEDVFSTWLYTGNGSTQTITNGVDLAGKGGLVWAKRRNYVGGNVFYDTVRGATKLIASNVTNAESTNVDGLTAFNSNGFSLGSGYPNQNVNGDDTYVSWTFRKQPKFFDVVTYTGDGVDDRQIPHSLGSKPGCVIIKRTDTTGDWAVSHRYDFGNVLFLNTTAAAIANPSSNSYFGYPVDPLQSTYFTVGTNAATNASGGTYVAYLFAHDAGGFGASGTDNVISCGSYTGNGSATGPTITLGYEPQWVMLKRASGGTGDWVIYDAMRGFGVSTSIGLEPNSSAAEPTTATDIAGVRATGFQLTTIDTEYNGNGDTYIYIAIRRGPMRTPTTGTSVFGLNARSGTGANATVTGGQISDAALIKNRGSAVGDLFAARLTGTGYLETSSTAAEVAAGTTVLQANPWDVMDGVKVGTTSTITNASSNTFINYLFRRAPGFFDVVCYTGTGVAGRSVSHNLTVAPEMVIVKRRNTTGDWAVLLRNVDRLGAAGSSYLLNTTAAWTSAGGYFSDSSGTFVPSTDATASVFRVSNATAVNASASTYVAYLFATVPGVSKVGSYTGTGTTLQVNCGFTGGARFVLIKRADSTGDWYVWDSARGIVAGNDPYLLLNSTAAEVTSTDYVDTFSSGFEISSTAPAAINANGGTFIFLAVS